MKRSYWEKMAPSYGVEIFDVLQNDKKALIRKVINQHASAQKTVMDIGCAIGKWLPVLSPAFKKVVAVDISAKNLEIAQQLYPQYKNVQYVRADMSGKKTKVPRCDFAICINAILTPHVKDRQLFFQSLSACVKKDGYIVLTIPSLESWMLTSMIQQEYQIDQPLFPPTKNAKEALRKWNNIRKGNVDIDDVPHKHYLKEELQLLLSTAGFVAETFQKIEYNWNTEFIKPPKWLKEPRPWDWMVVAKKK
ncbi:MAG TPA: class I SAM-dependent methyltransferase [Chitinophagaceae bacterium]|jgi:2-polyprenyl-3-methyl-5-hydroxy-6-metoxy-1,4-benzoquinol methylase|nr:class I SAM-dependent methyltransferase [Chitinophagaceae bacterium]HMX78079.1 class I SAM-dependent methyltransferase [Chitinophagaceae bacterium]HNA19224.1 class I SAM-dependent methyltransferase [Chitinophagaceae bacterium]HNA91697.1 class I SAM-dependent methyltransferase [Chitinophagaceae bacterium]HNF47122.1 class I SAM-dependent methyltransferase [Chitinophagaceae bacterium]